MVASCQATCVQLLVILGKIHAAAAGQALVSMLEACLNPDASNPAEGLTEQIVESLCRVAASCGHHKHMSGYALHLLTSRCFACQSNLFVSITAGPALHTCAPSVGMVVLTQLHAACRAADEASKSLILCRSLGLLEAAAGALEAFLRPQRFQADAFVMLFGQVEALFHACSQVLSTASSQQLPNQQTEAVQQVRTSCSACTGYTARQPAGLSCAALGRDEQHKGA